MRQFQEVIQFFSIMEDEVLLSYLTHMQYDILDHQQLSATVSEYTDVPDTIIAPTLETYLMNEAARRWYYNNLNHMFREEK